MVRAECVQLRHQAPDRCNLIAGGMTASRQLGKNPRHAFAARLTVDVT
jgi:hypothetical protein